MTVYSPLASASATRAVLDTLGRSTRKALGQHFLVDDGIVGKILRLAALAPNERIVEVGPGIGTLTQALLGTDDAPKLVSQAAITAVELDVELALFLEHGLAAAHPNLSVLAGDALAASTLETLLRWEPTALVANLPYAAAATIILEYFEQLPSLRSATVMVQREVADRICAAPGTKAYGAYTLKLQLVATVAGRFNVPPQSFYPPPRVESSVIRLERAHSNDTYAQRVKETRPSTQASLAQLIDATFFLRRKTIRNSMRAYFAEHGYAPDEVDQLLAHANIDPQTRGEVLKLEDFLRFTRCR